MKRFTNILYVLDGDDQQEERICGVVQDLARRNDARVRVVKVAEDNLVDSIGGQFSSRIQQLVELERRHHHDQLQAISNAPGWEKGKVAAELLIGRDFITIIRKVLAEDHDLVVKARRPEKGSDQLAMRLFRKCPCPVWIIDPNGRRPFGTILGAVDLAATTREEWQLNRKIVELTHSLALREEGQAHYLHAWHLRYEKSMRGPRFKMSDAEIDAMKRELLDARSEAFARLLQEAGVTADQKCLHLVEDSLGNAISSALTELPADVLIMGTVARTGLPGMLIGNKAEEVLGQVRCTVLAVKPNGFASPVTL